MKRERSLNPLLYASIGALLATTSVPLALGHDARAQGARHSPQGKHEAERSGELVRTVREATARFRDVSAAEAEGYQLLFGCVSGPDEGAMGLHYVNMELVGDGSLDPARPEIVIYEALPNGKLRLTGADFLVLAADWHANNAAPPELGGQLLHLFESPNRFGLPDFYTLHVWAWKENPSGMFVNWHPKVSCEFFDG
ncbi:MAG TPA: hypothetical protein VF193_18320 [Steroidobacter sp.]